MRGIEREGRGVIVVCVALLFFSFKGSEIYPHCMYLRKWLSGEGIFYIKSWVRVS